MASPFLEKNIDVREVQMGLNAAENEKRDAVESAYEKEALASDDPEEALDAIDHDTDPANSRAPELDAMHGIGRPENR